MDKPNQTDSSDIFSSSDELDKQESDIAAKLTEAREQQLGNKEEEKNGEGHSDADTQKDSSEKAQTNPDMDVLKFAEASTGRKFSTVDEFQKYLKNLNSLVGDQEVAKAREDSKKYNELVEKLASQSGQTVEAVNKAWADRMLELVAQGKEAAPKVESETKETKTDEGYSKINEELTKMRGKFERNELLTKYPFAKEFQDDIAVLASQKGVSQLEAFEGSPLKALLEAKAKEESAKSPVVTSSNRIGVDKTKIAEKATKVLDSGSEEDKIALVQAMGKSVGL